MKFLYSIIVLGIAAIGFAGVYFELRTERRRVAAMTPEELREHEENEREMQIW